MAYDADSGRYLGQQITVSGVAVLRRIQELTDAHVAAGSDAVDAAEQAWTLALDEQTWQVDECGVEQHNRGSDRW